MAIRRYQSKKKFNLPLVLFGMLLIGVAFVFSLATLADFSGKPETETTQEATLSRQQFIEKLVPHAQELQAGYGVLPSIIIGQAALESNFGQATLASKYNNLFGVKAFGDKPKVNLETQEYLNDQWVTVKGDFRVYESWDESMDAHTRLFVNGVDWDPKKYEPVLLAKDYKEAAQALQKAGYATDPTYADKIIAMIEEYHLDQYDHSNDQK
ncbi:glycoside hydrolase family 73 protein [Candidatus Enterococcus leclercqii]|uniref:glycoside hydrolase family 73 protein n=1 Tax=Candidatus Enterococcus leclercqii TaxID=1857218 RepID=UPI00137B5A53|nr:glycoside hydrolase family 73 protein [Enterococcus sp. CU9D]KAF1292080.1 N-acetylmuramoyl-L-alanine amidase [Enterococcus sp. CU9D]